jgi:nitroreductase
MDASEAVRPLLRVHQAREFTDAPVDTEALDAIADAARWSGSRANAQPWRFVVIRQPHVLRRLAGTNMPDTRAPATAAAAVAIVLPKVEGAAISNAFDEGRAAERMLIAASLLGLGAAITWVDADTRPAVGELLGLPKGWFVRTVVWIGHSTEREGRPKSTPRRARQPRSERVFSERWESEG